MKRILGSIRRADEKFRLIEDGDRICIGISGGKDSLLLMQAMKLYQRVYMMLGTYVSLPSWGLYPSY